MENNKKGLSIAMNAKLIGFGDETIVLAHGYGADQSIWDKILPYLVQKYKVLLFDWSFAGTIKDPNLFDALKYSSYDAFADDLIALMDEMNLISSSSSSSSSSIVFVGHSMSGMIGCIASIKHPQLFKRLVLVGASPRYMNSEDYEGGFEESVVEKLLSSIESNYEQWASSFASMVADTTSDDSASSSFEVYEKCLKNMKPEIALSIAKLVFLSDYRGILDKVTTPCTIIHTKNDVVVPNSVPEYMLNRISGRSVTEIIDTKGHFPHVNAHFEFVNVLDRALNNVD